MRQLGTQHHRAWNTLRWVVLAFAIVALGAFTLAPRLSSTGHAAPALASKKTPVFTLTSPDFKENGPIPPAAAFNSAGCVGPTGQGKNIPPVLNWVNGQSGFTGFPTLSYALTMADYDAPVGGGFHHWVIYNIPGTVTTLDAATIAESTPGMNDFSLLGYGGPCPPQDGQLHHYIFTLYALDVASLGAQGMTYNQLANAINAAVDSHGINFVVNGATVLIGTFVNPASS